MKSYGLLLAVVIIITFFPVSVFATQGFSLRSFDIYVDGLHFEAWGYGFGEIELQPSIRLHDIAYILNGTSAQFEILPSENFDFWIRRGEAYSVTFTELQPVLGRALFGAYGQNAVIGFDGEDYPAFSISLTAVRDIDAIYFSLYDLSYWLGFSVEWETGVGYQVDISTVPPTVPTPSRHICLNTFPVGSVQTIDYAYVLRVRTGAGNHYDILTFVNRGDEFKIHDYFGRFVQIETAQGRGWIFASFLSRRITAAEPVFVPPPRPESIVGRWTFEKLTESYHLNGAETEIYFWYIDWLTPTLRILPDMTFRIVIYGSVAGDIIQYAQNEYLLVNLIATSEGEVWYPDNSWLRYFPESGLLRYSFYVESGYIHYYFKRI